MQPEESAKRFDAFSIVLKGLQTKTIDRTIILLPDCTLHSMTVGTVCYCSSDCRPKPTAVAIDFLPPSSPLHPHLPTKLA